MGAETFSTIGQGKTMREAFAAAKERAEYDYGHAGYTGTIAEKDEAVVILMPDDFESQITSEAQRAVLYSDKLIADCDPRIDDKWGPAGAIRTAENTWLFFGWASS